MSEKVWWGFLGNICDFCGEWWVFFGKFVFLRKEIDNAKYFRCTNTSENQIFRFLCKVFSGYIIF